MQNEKGTYTFLVEPTDNLYYQLLEIAQSICKYALLVILHTIPVDVTAKLALEQLTPFLVSITESNEWPGTILTNSTAQIYKYNLETECINVLKKLSTRLYDWKQPYLPEDICFLKEDGSAWLVTTSHEADSYLFLTDQEYFQLLEEVPALRNIIRKE